jgi:hypothetical protein
LAWHWPLGEVDSRIKHSAAPCRSQKSSATLST